MLCAMALPRFRGEESGVDREDSLDYTWTAPGVEYLRNQELWIFMPAHRCPSPGTAVYLSQLSCVETLGCSLAEWAMAGYVLKAGTGAAVAGIAWEVCPRHLSEQFLDLGLLRQLLSLLDLGCLGSAACVARSWRDACYLELSQVQRAGEAWCLLNGRRHSGLSGARFFYRFGTKEKMPNLLREHAMLKLTQVDFPSRWKARLFEARTWHEVEGFDESYHTSVGFSHMQWLVQSDAGEEFLFSRDCD